MGILNVTPDSFSDGGRFRTEEAAVARGLTLLQEGADLIDLGGESTRPLALPVNAEEEQARLLPVLRGILRERAEAIVSVDTYHASTAERALDAGAEIVNDVSGLLWDPGMAAVLARGKAGAILMHTRGTPQTWSELPALDSEEVLPLVRGGLRESLELAEAAGIASDHLVLDPGFGFGKRGRENMALLARFGELRELGLPLLAGTSRKRFLTGELAKPTEGDRLHATTASHVAAILAGAHLLRVHDVPAARAAAFVADEVMEHVQGGH